MEVLAFGRSDIEAAVSQLFGAEADKLTSADPESRCWHAVAETHVLGPYGCRPGEFCTGPVRLVVMANIMRVEREGDAIRGFGRDKQFVVEFTIEVGNDKPHLKATILEELHPAPELSSTGSVNEDSSFHGKGFLC